MGKEGELLGKDMGGILGKEGWATGEGYEGLLGKDMGFIG